MLPFYFILIYIILFYFSENSTIASGLPKLSVNVIQLQPIVFTKGGWKNIQKM